MTRQKHGAVLSLEIFAAVEKCGADNKTNPKVSLLAGLFFMLLLSSADFSKLTFNKRPAGTQSKIVLIQISTDILGPDLGPNCLQRLSAGDLSRQGLIIHAPSK